MASDASLPMMRNKLKLYDESDELVAIFGFNF